MKQAGASGSAEVCLGEDLGLGCWGCAAPLMFWGRALRLEKAAHLPVAAYKCGRGEVLC